MAKPRKPLAKIGKKRREVLKASGKPMPYSTFSTKPYQGKSKEQLAYEAENRVRAMREGRSECEIRAVLEDIGGLAWIDFKRRNHAATFIWRKFETHHIHRREFGDHDWNMMRALKACHIFAHEEPRLALLAFIVAKDKQADIDWDAVYLRLKKYPLGFVVKYDEDGAYSGKAAGHAKRLFRKYGI
jgi:hypothetical protein